MQRRTLAIALTVAVVATLLGFGLLGLAAPGTTTSANRDDTTVDALVSALGAAGENAQVIVLDATGTSASRGDDDHDGFGDDQDDDDHDERRYRDDD